MEDRPNREIPTVFESTRQTRDMIGRDVALEEIHDAIYPRDGSDSFKLVLVEAKGGLGKTRLLEEVLCNTGHPRFCSPEKVSRWKNDGTAVTSGLIDVIDIRLHERHRFVDAVRQSFRGYDPAVKFRKFDENKRVIREQAGGAVLEQMRAAKEEAIDAFLKDIRELSDSHRVVIVVDTVERFDHMGPSWLYESTAGKDGLLEPDSDFFDRTSQGLARLIKERAVTEKMERRLKNITLILAGRPNSRFFNLIQAAAKEGGVSDNDIVNISLEALSMAEVRKYFRQRASEQGNTAEARRIATEFTKLANEDDHRHRVIGLFTGGSPVRLYMYAQLIADAKDIPEPLLQTLEEACEVAGTDPNVVFSRDDEPISTLFRPQSNGEPADLSNLKAIQWKVEEDFVDLLFKKTDPKSKVLLALLRSPRGLTAEQLHFLDSEEQRIVHGPSNKQELQDYLKILKGIERSYLGKRRSSWDDLEEVLRNEVAQTETYRVGLQDEIYRIYSNHRHPFSQSKSWVSQDKLKDYEEAHDDELKARRDQYRKLADWADSKQKSFRKMKQEFLKQDERDLDLRIQLDNPNTFEFSFLGDREVRRRSAINSGIIIFEIERMVYRLLLKPQENITFNQMAPEDNRAIAARPEEDFWAQAEKWQVLTDEDLMRFVRFDEHDFQAKQMAGRDENYPELLIRVLEQDDVVRWIKRFVFRGKYQKAYEFAERVEKRIESWPKAPLKEKNKLHSWSHPLALNERIIWREYAQIMLGNTDRKNKAGTPLNNIRRAVKELQELHDTPQGELVELASAVSRDNPSDEPYQVYGFGPSRADLDDNHPGWIRLGWILSHAHDILGYAYRQRGEYRNAVLEHGKSLNAIRPWPYSEMSKGHLATILNNLSRALQEMGMPSEVICLDGLHIRRELAEGVSMAASYNTLARIYDGAGRYEDAARLSAKSIALCMRAGEPRQQALSLLQMATSLRHLAYRIRSGGQSADEADKYLSAAEKMLYSARAIFQNRKDIIRQIEVEIERGRLLRDQLRHQLQQLEDQEEQEKQGERDRHAVLLDARTIEIYLEAREILEEVVKLAAETGLPQIALNAQTNLARVHYFFGALAKDTQVPRKYDVALRDAARRVLDLKEAAEEKVETILNEIEQAEAYQSYRNALMIQPLRASQDQQNKTWIFRQLSTAQKIRGWLALDRYKARVHHWKTTYRLEDSYSNRADTRRILNLRQASLEQDIDAKSALEEAFVCYARGMGFAELFAPRSRSVVFLQDDLYNRLHRSNRGELKLQHEQLQAVRNEDYGFGELEPMFQILDKLLHQYFGLSDPCSAVTRDGTET